MIVALRIAAYLMLLGRTCPDLEAVLFFNPDEIHDGAHLLMNQRRPLQPPRLNDMVRLVAQCGGFLVRKGDGTRLEDNLGRLSARHDYGRNYVTDPA
ncbi:MAG: IS4 family transposase [Burkholderia sp.]